MSRRRNRGAARALFGLFVAIVVHVGGVALFMWWGSFGVEFKTDPVASSATAAREGAEAAANEDRPIEIETLVNQLEKSGFFDSVNR